MLPDLPSLSPFSFRLYKGESDLSAMRAVHDACRERDRIDPYSVCYKVPNLSADDYAHLLQDSAPDTILLAEHNGTVVAHAWMEAWGIEERLYLWRVWVMPEWRGVGLGTTMHRWGEARSFTLHQGDTRTALHLANATEGEADAVRLLENEGYHLSFISPELAFDAFHTLPTVPQVPGITLRPLEPAAFRAVARALSEANLNPPNYKTQWSGEELEHRIDAEEAEWLARVRSSEPALSPVAWEGDTVVGAYLCQRKGVIGEISQVAVRAGWRGRGIARALAMHSLHGLQAAGCVTARLFTAIGPDQIEPTTGPYAMYRKFGFAPIARHLRYRKAMQ